MSDAMETVLRQVAAGQLSPEEALRLLEPPPTPAAPSAPAAAAAPSDPTVPAEPALRRVKVKSSYRSLEIVGDPQVAQVHVSGEHSVRWADDVMVITTPGPLDDETDTPLFSFSALPRTLNWIRSWRDRQVQIRVNPALAVDLELTGVELQLTGVSGGLSGRINASAVKLDRVSGAIDLQTFSSSCKGNIVVRKDSRLVCESSSVRLTLAEGTGARVEAVGRMGRLSLPDDAGPPQREGEIRRFSVGSGEALLAVDSVMSSVTLDVPGWAKSA
jgi:hypothetical protein